VNQTTSFHRITEYLRCIPICKCIHERELRTRPKYESGFLLTRTLPCTHSYAFWRTTVPLLWTSNGERDVTRYTQYTCTHHTHKYPNIDRWTHMPQPPFEFKESCCWCCTRAQRWWHVTNITYTCVNSRPNRLNVVHAKDVEFE
jgi:hypothetical protein